MKFTELEQLMSSRGIITLADFARALDTTPQAVSNWKSRDQVPYHIIDKLNQTTDSNTPLIAPDSQSSLYFQENTFSLSDILLTMAEQLKIILLVPFITVFLTFTHVQFIKKPLYESSSTIVLPENKSNLGGFAGLASQFGVGVSQTPEADLSSPSLFPELIKSRTFAERILDKPFYTEQYGRELSLLAIFTYGVGSPKFGRDTLIQRAMGAFQGMVDFTIQGSFSILTVKAGEPRFARDVNKAVLDELQALNRYYRSQHVNEKINFIENRIQSVKNDLEQSEQNQKSFREQNRQVSSPALQLEEERLTRDVEIQKGIYLTIKQQLELAKIEEIQEASIIQVLDGPQIPLGFANKKLKVSIMLAGVLGIGFGILLGFVRAYLNNSDIKERRKLRRVRNFMKKKSKDIVFDRRVCGIVSILLLYGLPYYLGHQSENPVFFGMYSYRLMFINTFYVLILITSVSLFIYLTRKKL